MKKGEEVRVLVDYDLFDQNVKDEIGIYVKTSEATGKHLVYFSINEEWGEFTDDQIERLKPGKVPKKNKEWSSNIRTMTVTYG